MYTVKQIAAFLDLKNDNNSIIQGLSKHNKDNTFGLSWAKDTFNLKKVEVGAVICNYESFKNISPKEGVEYLIVKNPRLAFTKVFNEFFSEKIPDYFTNLHEEHRKNKKLKIGSNVFIGKDVELGDGCVIHNNVSIYSNTKIGENCVIKSFSSIGSEGLGQEFDYKADSYVKFPQIGNVKVGDNVEIGPYSTIRRSALGSTFIEIGTKIGSYCNIGHNCFIGRNCLLTSNVIIAGSSTIQDNVFIGIGALIRNNVIIGKKAIVGLGAVVVKNIPENETWVGNPAKKIK